MDNENIYDKMRRISEQRLKNDDTNDRKNVIAKHKLLGVLEKKFKTTFIGDLSQFQQIFGFLWGDGKNDNERDDDERYFYDLWQQVRTNVLNNGNNQYRAVQNELQQYNITWQGYNIKMEKRED